MKPWVTPLALLGLVLLWEVVGLADGVAGGALPAVSEILQRFWADRADYPPHLLATLRAAVLGFLLGNSVAVVAALLMALLPITERLLRGINITLFALPPITLVPLLVIALPGESARITLAAISVYFPTMVATLLGLRSIDPRLVDLIAAWGGGRWTLLLKVRLRSCLPAMLAGLQVAAPAAVLGAILAEFGGGMRWGLGSYLLGSLGRADPARLWGIGLTATLMAGLAYGVFGWLAGWFAAGTRDVTLAANRAPEDLASESQGARSWWWRWVMALVSLLLVLGLWSAVMAALGLSPIVAYGPRETFQYLVLSPRAGESWVRLLTALSQTLPIALLGLACGLTTAFTLAVVGRALPLLARLLMPMALVSQSMPLVALTPLIVLVFGRNLSATLVITVSVTFFPAYVLIGQGLARVPRAAHDVLDAYGASLWSKLRLVDIPNAVPYLMAAGRLAAPRALLGVMIAEWLATGYGLGNLLNQSRGRLDYGMIWSVAVVSVVVAVLLYQAFVFIEVRVQQRYV